MKGPAGSLRIGVAAAWLVAWNILFGIAFWINGGLVLPLRSPIAICLTLGALFGTALFSLAVAFVPRVAIWALKPGAQVAVIRKELLFYAFIAAAIGLGWAIFPFIGTSSV